MTSETHRSVSEVITDLSVQFSTNYDANARTLHCYDEELTALRAAEKNLLAQIQRLEIEKYAHIQRCTMGDNEFAEVSRSAIFKVLDGQKTQLELRSQRHQEWWNEAVHACIDDALDAAGFSALREDIQHENGDATPTIGPVGLSSKSVMTAHPSNELRTVRHMLHRRITELSFNASLPLLHLDMVLSVEAVTDNDFGITFVLPVAGASIEEEGGQSLSVSLVHRILEGMYVYLGQTPKGMGHVHVGAHDGLTILELDVVMEATLDEVTAALIQCVRHHVCRSSELMAAGIRPRVTVVDADLLFPAAEASDTEMQHAR